MLAEIKKVDSLSLGIINPCTLALNMWELASMLEEMSPLKPSDYPPPATVPTPPALPSTPSPTLVNKVTRIMVPSPVPPTPFSTYPHHPLSSWSPHPSTPHPNPPTPPPPHDSGSSCSLSCNSSSTSDRYKQQE